MKVCEYFLPCGRCDKFNKPCDLTVKDLENYQIMIGSVSPETADEIKNKNECNHEWRYGIQSATGHHYICIKCGTMKVVPLENLSLTDIKCDHEWSFYKSTENTGGKCIYYRCCKCGAIMMKDYNGAIYESGEWMP